MVLVHHAAQPAAGNVGVDLGGANIGMPQHRLDAAQIGAALKQMRGKRMSQHVRRNMMKNPHRFPMLRQ
jgi:hypothetical protein